MSPHYYGTGGGQGAYPWTIMVKGPAEIEEMLLRTATRLQTMGVARMVLLSGHFADEPLALIDTFAADLVELAQLPPLATAPDTPDRHHATNPIWGVFGQDPRGVDLAESQALCARMVTWPAEHGRD